MRNDQTERYESPLSAEFDANVVDRASREIHREVFSTWLGFRLRQQERDATVWMASLNLGTAEGIRVLETTTKGLSRLLPKGYAEPERELFFHNFRLVSTMVRGVDVDAGFWSWQSAEADAGGESRAPVSRVRGWFQSLLTASPSSKAKTPQLQKTH